MWESFKRNIKTNLTAIFIILMVIVGRYLEIDKDVLICALGLIGAAGLTMAKDPPKKK